MGDRSKAVFLKKFNKALKNTRGHLGKVENLGAPMRKTLRLSRVAPTGLLGLPFEIRLQIFYYCIPRKHIIDKWGPRFYIGWPYEKKDHTVDLDNALDFKDDILGLKGTLELEDTLSFEDDVVKQIAVFGPGRF